tara:strand:- start:17118 stop:17318 length:201 start_codon:yes stop_codon:yes gene_type:complete
MNRLAELEVLINHQRSEVVKFAQNMHKDCTEPQQRNWIEALNESIKLLTSFQDEYHSVLYKSNEGK